MPRRAAGRCESWVLYCCGSTDLDDIFAYRTYREVEIRDRRLGIASWVCNLGIVVYVLLQLLYKGEYLSESPVEGTARLTIAAPSNTCTGAQRRQVPPPAHCKDCDPQEQDKVCYDMFGNVSRVPYCTQYEGSRPAAHQLPCRYEEAANSGKAFQSSLLVATMALERNQTKNCSARPDDPLYQGGDCDRVYVTVGKDEYFFADIEDFWVLISHAVRTQDGGQLHSSVELVGQLRVDENQLCELAAASGLNPVDSHGEPVAKAPCFLKPNITDDGRDFVSVRALLAAAGIDLDAPVTTKAHKPSSARMTGTTLLISVAYRNWKEWQLIGPSSAALPSYEYEVSALPSDSYVYTEPIYEAYPVRRSLVQRYGVRIVVLQTGILYKFDLLSALITATTALTLISITTFLVDTVATTVMPGSQLYRDYKTLVTPDMSDVRDGVRCATCNEVLTVVPVEEDDGDGHCGVCDKDVPPGNDLYRCSNCPRGPVDRCEACLVASTINQPAKLNLHALVLAAYDTDHDGFLSFDEFEQLRDGFVEASAAARIEVDLPDEPDPEDWDRDRGAALKTWLRALSAPEREALRRHLRPNQLSLGSSKWTPAVAFLRATMRIGSGHDMLRIQRDHTGRAMSVRTLRSMRKTPSLAAHSLRMAHSDPGPRSYAGSAGSDPLMFSGVNLVSCLDDGDAAPAASDAPYGQLQVAPRSPKSPSRGQQQQPQQQPQPQPVSPLRQEPAVQPRPRAASRKITARAIPTPT
eukprot:TRINITY_DN5753_c0_g1_i1.p1 TRINITY_DN5753_c0_g1~~TRINITY_DN5753_c0_g1_i1.p1  ORF type:complete len:750 (+),score=178.34 TRINITY_DN5753_c0_g1_i1:114-2363(+)